MKVEIVAVTAYTSDEIKNQALSSGMRDVLGKPVNAHKLEMVMYKWFYGFSDKEIKKKMKMKKLDLLRDRQDEEGK